MDDPSDNHCFARAVFLLPTFQRRGLSGYCLGDCSARMATQLTLAGAQCLLHRRGLLLTGADSRPLLHRDAGPAWTEGWILLLHRTSAARSVLHARRNLAHESAELATTGNRSCCGTPARLLDAHISGVRRWTKPPSYPGVSFSYNADPQSHAARLRHRFQGAATKSACGWEEHGHCWICTP
jgi:hypothetical protein